ncbi:NAD(+) diphosphatase [Trichloromonas sp.]|uniref:NAD(+) diphosphatase n=1 Tax=Trichloromonas sp. TaxID=3069249 RepID=UPI003D815834
MSPYPDFYPSPQHLPFNHESIKHLFQPQFAEDDPGGEGVWLLVRGSELLVRELELPDGDLPGGLSGESAVYIGRWQGRPCRVLPVSRQLPVPAGLTAEHLQSAEPKLSLELLSLGALGAQVLHWEKNSRCCSRCGGRMERIAQESGKTCLACGALHFPHIHPCVIVLVRRGDEVLLVRKAEWADGRYGLVAGFLDRGECLEEAVAREVLEETGIRVQNIRYVGSQSWPFPSQLMAGFVADYAGGEIVVEEKELEDARWFAVTEMPTLPPKRSIARYLIDTFAVS